MGVPVKPTISVIYNSLRYDDSTHIVTFHLREKDWDELKSTSRMWISSTNDGLFQVINREPVPLGDEIVKSSQVVDPLDTFGLFSVQTFTVPESSENCQELKVTLRLVMLITSTNVALKFLSGEQKTSSLRIGSRPM